MQLRIYGNEHSLPFLRSSEPRNDNYQLFLSAQIPMDKHQMLLNYLAATALQVVPLTPNNITPYLGVAKTVVVKDNVLEVTTKKNVKVSVNCASQYAITLPLVEGLQPLPIKGFAADTVIRLCLPLAVESKKVVSKDATTLNALHNNVFSTTYGTQCATIMRTKIEPLTDLPAHSKGFGFLGYVYTKMHRANPTGLSNAMMMARQSETSVIRSLTSLAPHNIPDIEGNPVNVQVITTKPTYVPSCPVLDFEVIPLMYYNSVQNVHGGNGSTSSQFNSTHVDGLPLDAGDRDFIDRCKDLSLILQVLPDTVTDFYINTGDPTYCKKIHKQIIHSRRAKKLSKEKIFVHHVHNTDMTNESFVLVQAHHEGGVVYHASLPDDPDGCFLSLESSIIENASTPVDIESKMKAKHSGFLSKLKSYFGWHFVVDSFTLGPSLPNNCAVYYYPSSRGNVCNCIVGYTRGDKYEGAYTFRNNVVDKDLAHKVHNLSYQNIQYHVYHQVKHAHQLRFHRSLWNSCVNDLNQAATAFANENNMDVMSYHRIAGVTVYYLTPEEEANINASMWGSSKYIGVSLDVDYVDNGIYQAPRPNPRPANAVAAPMVVAPPPPVPRQAAQPAQRAQPTASTASAPIGAASSSVPTRGTSIPPVKKQKKKKAKKEKQQQQEEQSWNEQSEYQSKQSSQPQHHQGGGGRGLRGRGGKQQRGRSVTPKERLSVSPTPLGRPTPNEQYQGDYKLPPFGQQSVNKAPQSPPTKAPAQSEQDGGYQAKLTEKTDLSLYS